LAALPVEDFFLLEPHLRIVPLERGAKIHEPDDEIEHIYFPLSGMVSLVAVMRSGATVETANVGRAGILGFTAGFGARRVFGRAIVQIAGDAARIPRSQFQWAAGESGAIRRLVAAYNHVWLTQVHQSVACSTLHYLEARLCRWLLQTQDCIGSEKIPLTQEQLGQRLGVRRNTLTVVARALQKAEMISYRRGIIRIINRAKLEQNACECYATIRRQTDELFQAIT